MKRNFSFAHLQGVPSLNIQDISKEKGFGVIVDTKDEGLDLIYAPSELTGLPQSAVAVFKSKDTNPLVRKFIEDNLMFDGNLNDVPHVPDGVSDEDLAYLVRGRYETQSDYIKRVNAYMSFQKAQYITAKKSDKTIETKEKEIVDNKNE